MRIHGCRNEEGMWVRIPENEERERIQLAEDIATILERIQTIRDAIITEKEEILASLKEKKRFTMKLVYLQEQKGQLTLQYDDLFASFNAQLDSNVQRNLNGDASPEEFRLRSVSRQLTALSSQIRECDVTLQQIELNVAEEIQSMERKREWSLDLEDLNTKWSSLRIQLARLIKCRSAILERYRARWYLFVRKDSIQKIDYKHIFQIDVQFHEYEWSLADTEYSILMEYAELYM